MHARSQPTQQSTSSILCLLRAPAFRFREDEGGLDDMATRTREGGVEGECLAGDDTARIPDRLGQELRLRYSSSNIPLCLAPCHQYHHRLLCQD